jgi:hypothetical protein
MFAVGCATAVAEPLYPLPAHDEDWRFLANGGSDDFWDRFKFVPLRDDSYLSFGGEVRETYERFRNPDFGFSERDASGYFLHRHLLHADLHWADSWRLFAKLRNSFETGRNGGPRPVIDENRLDLHEAFAEWTSASFLIRAGRQEIALGSARILSLREEPNVPLSFDALRFGAKFPRWRLDAFAAEPVRSIPETFDDTRDRTYKVWGVYATVAPFDLYYLGSDRDRMVFNQGAARERRHTLGMRLLYAAGGWHLDHEVMYQSGTFGSGDIQAWRVSTDTSYQWTQLPWKPTLRFVADAASGDRDPLDPDLQTFNAYFQSGSYSCRCLIEGPANNLRLQPNFALHPTANLRIRAGWAFFWRQSRMDGMYSVPGTLLVPSSGVRARYEGDRLISQIDWQLTRHASLHMNYAYYFTGRFGKEAQDAPSSLAYLSVWAAYRF